MAGGAVEEMVDIHEAWGSNNCTGFDSRTAIAGAIIGRFFVFNNPKDFA